MINIAELNSDGTAWMETQPSLKLAMNYVEMEETMELMNVTMEIESVLTGVISIAFKNSKEPR